MCSCIIPRLHLFYFSVTLAISWFNVHRWEVNIGIPAFAKYISNIYPTDQHWNKANSYNGNSVNFCGGSYGFIVVIYRRKQNLHSNDSMYMSSCLFKIIWISMQLFPSAWTGDKIILRNVYGVGDRPLVKLFWSVCTSITVKIWLKYRQLWR